MLKKGHKQIQAVVYLFQVQLFLPSLFAFYIEKLFQQKKGVFFQAWKLADPFIMNVQIYRHININIYKTHLSI